ncbi:hypothetical protein CEXT_517541 [Caerostris extrusa]|uniref:Uncharacterized protein n=1 Tax=Caerostris extrusa TaxID=172846 RepID=A0AAV4U6R4_CAEEX|nr:hypothetical protein CEXT_517541 [Caerostris extrusa]
MRNVSVDSCVLFTRETDLHKPSQQQHLASCVTTTVIFVLCPARTPGRPCLSSNRSLPRCCLNNNNNRSLKIEIPRWKLKSKNACVLSVEERGAYRRLF